MLLELDDGSLSRRDLKGSWAAIVQVEGSSVVANEGVIVLLVCESELDFLCGCLAVRDLRATCRTWDAVFTFHALNVDFEVEFAHSGDDSLLQDQDSEKRHNRNCV